MTDDEAKKLVRAAADVLSDAVLSVIQDDPPAFVVEDDVPPVPECKKPRNGELMDTNRVQTLENQVAMLLAMLPPMYNGVEKIDTVQNLTNVRAESVKLLERLKKNEDHGHKS